MPQGTIKEFDEGTRTGALLMEDRSEIQIDPASLEGSAIRTLRIGQRVKFEIEDREGRRVARTLRIVTID